MNWKKIAAAIALCGAAGTAGAVGNIADVTVYDRAENRTLPVYRHDGRYYVVGKPGNEYQVRVRNRAGADILAVVSVDGVNAVSGETANWSQTGYVLGPRPGLRHPGLAQEPASGSRPSSSPSTRTRTPRAPAGRRTSA